MRRIFLAFCLLWSSSCGGGGAGSQSPSPSPSPTPAPAGITDADLQHCIDVINGYRRQVGRPSLTRSAALEAFAAKAAANDAQSKTSHQYFVQTNGGGVAAAENEVLAWSLTEFHTVSSVTDNAELLFWQEGPSGGHYQNMIKYSQAGCGYHIDGAQVTMTNDFR